MWGPVRTKRERSSDLPALPRRQAGGRQVPPGYLNMGALRAERAGPHAPASHQQSWIPGSTLALAKPEARFAQGFTLTRRIGLVNSFEPETPVDS